MSTSTEVQSVPDPRAGVNRTSDKAILNYIKNSLRQTRPWTRLISILGFLAVVVAILTGIAIIAGQNVLQRTGNAPPPVFIGIINILVSVFYLVPSIWLFKYSSAIKHFLDGGGAIELGNALAYQKSFWRFVGITTLISMVIAVLGILASILIPSILSFQRLKIF